MSRKSVTPRDLSNTGFPAGFPKTRANKAGGMLRIKSAMWSLCLCECGPHSPIATTVQRSETSVPRNSSGLWVLAWGTGLWVLACANAEIHLSWSAEAALQTLGGRQQEGEVTQAAAQRMCQYKQASDALNWTELTTRIFIYYWVE